MKRAIALVMAAAAISACAPKDFSKEGSRRRAVHEGRIAVPQRRCGRGAQQERNIDDQRRATFSAERERYGQQGLYSDMANQGYKYNFERGMASCMEARGWAPKQTGPIPMPKLTW